MKTHARVNRNKKSKRKLQSIPTRYTDLGTSFDSDYMNPANTRIVHGKNEPDRSNNDLENEPGTMTCKSQTSFPGGPCRSLTAAHSPPEPPLCRVTPVDHPQRLSSNGGRLTLWDCTACCFPDTSTPALTDGLREKGE